MKTKLIIASAILFISNISISWGDHWIGNSAVNVNGKWYYCGNSGMSNWCTGGAFHSTSDTDINLGEISVLHLGGQTQVFDEATGAHWNAESTVDMFYVIDGNEPDPIPSIPLTIFAWEGYGNNMAFQSGGGNFAGTEIDISSLDATQTHTLTVYFHAYHEGMKDNNPYTLSVWDSNKDAQGVVHNYVARFKIKAPTSISKASDIIVDEDTPVDVKVKGLTLYKDGYWNTLCLPFTLTKGDVQMSELSGAEIRKLENGSVSGSTLTLNFSSSLNPANGTDVLIEAGKPYIIKWSGGTNIEDPVFTNVKISTNQAGEVAGTGVTFKGTFDQITFEEASDNVLFVGDNNTLYYPDNGAKILPFRAYFDVTGASKVKAINLNFGDDTNSIQTISNETSSNNDYYTIDGRRLNDKPATAGLYIINGKKVVIK